MNKKKACLIFTAQTKQHVEKTASEIANKGYAVCSVQADTEVAVAAKLGNSDLPVEILNCIRDADLCVVILPEDPAHDGAIDACAAQSNQLATAIICLVDGVRSEIPANIDDQARSCLRVGSSNLSAAIDGAEIWENSDGTAAPDRKIRHQQCQ
jgi:hypothetical protein